MHKRNHSLDLLKLFFMLIIVIHHLGSWSDYLMNGYICVEFFFMVSGYLVMKKINNNIFSIVDIMKKRLLRLYPHYLLSFIVMFMSVNIYRNGRIDIQQFFSSIPEILLIQNIGVFNGGLNYPCWYLSVMLFSTLIILLLYKLVSKNIFRIIIKYRSIKYPIIKEYRSKYNTKQFVFYNLHVVVNKEVLC